MSTPIFDTGYCVSFKIGVFDSGIGGLSVVNQLMHSCNAHIVYVADTANMPYGSKSPEEITQLSERMTQFLINQNVTHIIIACHTISAIFGSYLASKYPHVTFITMLQVVIPAALKATATNRIGIMATPATIKSKVHTRALQLNDPTIVVVEQACPTLAPTIEHYFDDVEMIKERIAFYLEPLIAQNIDTLILGCTHYDLIHALIREYVGNSLHIIGSDTFRLSAYATMQDDESQLILECFVSDKQDVFAEKLVHLIDVTIPVSIRPF